jgi:hypothetical protein
MNESPLHAWYAPRRILLLTALVCAAGLAQAQSNAPASTAPVAPPPPTIATPNTAVQVQEQPDRSTAQEGSNAPAPTAEPPTAASSDAADSNLLDRKTQKVEHLHFEDNGNRVDEIRSGGQTRRITVQPKDGAPAYQVLPASPNTTRPDGGIGQTGPRVWNIHQF